MYDFQPLPIDGIRLLKIQPKLRNGDVACILNQYHDHIPPYDALSYYWGDPKPTRKVHVNEVLVDIHEALWEFLDQMQRSQETETWIWTDFLCLDQRNNEEMGQQIPRMGQIYSQAKRTVSWLGCNRSSWALRPHGLFLHTTDMEEEFRLIAEKVAAKGSAVQSFFAQPRLLHWTHVTKLMVDGNRVFDVSRIVHSEFDQQDALRGLPKPIKEVVQLSQGHMMRPILNALSLPYWTRVWIAQEVALAKKVTLIFGDVSIDFDKFLLSYKAYYYYMLQKAPRDCAELRVPIEARAAVHENNVSFQQVVRWGHDCYASKPVDRIYGLLGLLARCGDGTNRLPATLTGTISYTRALREVYWDIALMTPFSIDSSTVDGNDHIEVIERWVNLLPTLGLVLDYPFTPENLWYADNEGSTRQCKDKARLALFLVALCRQANITNSSILIKQTDTFPRESWSSRPIKLSADHLWYNPSQNLKRQTVQFHRLLGSLLLERSRGMNENDEYQAAIIGLIMSQTERSRGRWNCVSDQSILDISPSAPGNELEFSFDCSIGPTSSQLPCSLLSTTLRSRPGNMSHQCRTPDRYLLIHWPQQGETWKLSLEDLYKGEDEDYWRGTLKVKCLIL